MKRLTIGILGVLLLCSAAPAYAELWSALNTIPKPNAVIALDTSVTMRINIRCTNCHREGLSRRRQRYFLAREDILATIPLFRNNFIFGAMEYQGCEFASIRRRSPPNAADPNQSYADAYSLIRDVRACNQRESRYPGGALTSCITPTPLCVGDGAIARDVVTGRLPGLSLPSFPAARTATCDNPARVSPTLDLEAELANQLSGVQWPRWDDDHITPRHAEDDLCAPLRNALNQVRVELSRCLLNPDAFWDLSALPTSSWCNPSTIAGSACTSGSILRGTCICDSEPIACHAVTGTPLSDCGTPLTWKARQQVAICEAYNTDPGHIGEALINQADNRVNPGGCRENVAMFFTDGFAGGTAGVAAEAIQAQATYASASGQPNMYVFRISNEFNRASDAMMQRLTSNLIADAFDARDRVELQSAFSRVIARVFKGDYGGSSLALSPAEDRIAVSSFIVPGYTSGAPVDDAYIGWPMRVAFYSIDAAGSVDPTPRFQTDWQGKVDGSSSCGYHELGGTLPSLIGPDDHFGNGVDRNVVVPPGSLGDRDGDGIDEPSRTLRWGRSFGFAATRPVIVEAPNEVPNPQWGLEWAAHRTSNEDRPRMVYTMGGGYVLGFHGGRHLGAGTFAGSHVSHTYQDSSSEAGVEVLRYRPAWIAPGAQRLHNPKYELSANPVLPQRLLTGGLVARETYIEQAGTGRFATLLVGAQGAEGAGYFALDVSDPCSPSILSEWLLPVGAYASSRPEIYYFPQSTAPEQRAAVVVTGGLDGLGMLYAYDVRDGHMLASILLPIPSGTSYPTAPVCVDIAGEGVITHCYVLRSDGYLARVGIDLAGGGFSSVENITPLNTSSRPITMLNSQFFSTEPVAYFGTDGAVNLVFGSGSHEDLTVAGPDNAVYKVVDSATRVRGIPSGPATTSDVCEASSGDTSGVISLPPGERLVSAPVVTDGVVAWTTYFAATSGCVSGTGHLYAMRYDTCEDALATGPRPTGIAIGDGLPTSPVVSRVRRGILTRTSAGTEADDVGGFSADTTSSGRPWARRLYWRYELDIR